MNSEPARHHRNKARLIRIKELMTPGTGFSLIRYRRVISSPRDESASWNVCAPKATIWAMASAMRRTPRLLIASPHNHPSATASHLQRHASQPCR